MGNRGNSPFWAIFRFRGSNRDSEYAIVFRIIELLMKTADRCLIWPKLLSEKILKKFTSENRPFSDFFELSTNAFTGSLFGKTEYFRFSSIKFLWSVVWPFWSWGKIALSLENIPNTQKVCLECIEKIFWRIFKNHIFSKKLFLKRKIGQTSVKKTFSKKYGFWRFVRKSLLGNPDILSGYLECSPDSGLSFPNFRMVIRQFFIKISYFECNTIFLVKFWPKSGFYDFR